MAEEFDKMFDKLLAQATVVEQQWVKVREQKQEDKHRAIARGHYKQILKKNCDVVRTERIVPSQVSKAETVQAYLRTLPYLAISRLFHFLDVSSLAKLSSTCKYFEQMVKRSFVLCTSIPFSVSQLQEIAIHGHSTKPVLRLVCKKSEEQENFPGNKHINHKFSLSDIITIKEEYDDNLVSDYIVLSQLSFLDLRKLREVDVVPHDVLSLIQLSDDDVEFRDKNSFLAVDFAILVFISRQGLLGNLTKLSVVMDEGVYLTSFMGELTGLLELEPTIITDHEMTKHWNIRLIKSLQSLVAASRAPSLKMIVHQIIDFPFLHIEIPFDFKFENKFIEFLKVEGPCAFFMLPVMERLKEMTVKVDACVDCHYKKNDADAGAPQHVPGVCCVVFDLDTAGVEVVSAWEWRWRRTNTRDLEMEKSRSSRPRRNPCEVCYQELQEDDETHEFEVGSSQYYSMVSAGLEWICCSCSSSM